MDWILCEISMAISRGMFAFDTALASCPESSKIEITFESEDPHLVHNDEVPPLHPNECPQTHLRNCHSALT